MRLELESIQHHYARQQSLFDMTLILEQGQIGCLLGPSGCGKSTVLRCIAGLEAISSGSIRMDGREVSKAGYTLTTEKRGVGLVFQDHALFPHQTVIQNVLFGLNRLRGEPRWRRARETLELVGLGDRHACYPHELSGGQRQRVALARAIAPRPSLLLLDEPFSSLDAELRERLCVELRDILKGLGTTALLVTHDQHEAYALADEVGVVNHGVLQQWAPPYELYHRPANRFVADFVGEGVLLAGEVLSETTVNTSLGRLSGELSMAVEAGQRVDVLVRPDDIIDDAQSLLKARVVRRLFRGAETLYTLELDRGDRVLALLSSHHNYAMGDVLGIRTDMRHIVLFRR